MVVLTASDGIEQQHHQLLLQRGGQCFACGKLRSQTIQATLNANAQYTIDPNQLNENSTDACGIQSLSASPAVLDCQHEGTNTVTLTVTDNNGNTASCTPPSKWPNSYPQPTDGYRRKLRRCRRWDGFPNSRGRGRTGEILHRRWGDLSGQRHLRQPVARRLYYRSKGIWRTRRL
ncbi:MAG: hypothetical protein R2825_12625 [Saprospiraceae bacterium]